LIFVRKDGFPLLKNLDGGIDFAQTGYRRHIKQDDSL